MLKPKTFADFAKEFSGNIFETSSQRVDLRSDPYELTSTKGESWGAGAKFLKKHKCKDF